MIKYIDEQTYTANPSLRIAYIEGRMAMCEEIKSFMAFLMETATADSKKMNAFQTGQMKILQDIAECIVQAQSELLVVQLHEHVFDAG